MAELRFNPIKKRKIEVVNKVEARNLTENELKKDYLKHIKKYTREWNLDKLYETKVKLHLVSIIGIVKKALESNKINPRSLDAIKTIIAHEIKSKVGNEPNDKFTKNYRKEMYLKNILIELQNCKGSPKKIDNYIRDKLKGCYHVFPYDTKIDKMVKLLLEKYNINVEDI